MQSSYVRIGGWLTPRAELNSNVVNANYNEQSDVVVLVTERNVYYYPGKLLTNSKVELHGVPFGHINPLENGIIQLSKSVNKKEGDVNGCEW